MSSAISQVGAVASMNLKTIGERRGASLSTIFGVAGVVAVFVGVLSIGEGFRASMNAGGRPDVAMVMRSGNDSEMMSGIQRANTELIRQAPGVLRDAQGPVASAELFVVVSVPKRSTDSAANVPLRGVQAKAMTVRESVKIVEGRMFEPGRNEVIVGRAAAREFKGLDLGTTNRWGPNSWTVVGVFEDGGSVVESEIWCDAAVLQPAYNRGDFFQSVRARLVSKDDFQTFKDAITKDPRLDVQVERENEYFAKQSEGLTTLVTVLGSIIAILMGFGAVFGALNTMYSAVSSRTREIATLRAIGFQSAPVVVSVLAESMVLALAGGLLGAVAAYFGFDGFQAATLNWQSFSQVAFQFAVTPKLLAIGITYALVMGLVGGLFPAIRAARLPVTAALREL
jgi:putative ABC transport system permease protein